MTAKRTQRSLERQRSRESRADTMRELRSALYSRAYGVCERCGGRPEHPHHKLPRGRGGKDELANLVLLCHECHSAVHDHRAADWRAWID